MQAVILAAGESSRFWPFNQNHKSQFYLLGKPLIYWTSKGLTDKDVPALKYLWELFGLLDILFKPATFKASISSTASIGKNVVIKGQTYIGKNTIIKENTIIEGPCFIGDNCEIGYSNVLRGPINIESNVKTGAFTEIKHSIIQQGTHIHSGYIGDSIIGKDCRMGAGFVVANKRLDRKTIKSSIREKKIDTGLTFFGTVVGDETHFGIHSGTMPGVFIGSQCVVGPGTFVFENLEDNSVLYAKTEKVIKKR